MGTLPRTEIFFFLLKEHHTFFGQPTSPATTVVGDVKNSSLIDQRRLKWRVASEYMALGDSCGGINPYTLTARLGQAQIRGFGPPKDNAQPSQPVWSPAQGVKIDLAIKQDPGRLE